MKYSPEYLNDELLRSAHCCRNRIFEQFKFSRKKNKPPQKRKTNQLPVSVFFFLFFLVFCVLCFGFCMLCSEMIVFDANSLLSPVKAAAANTESRLEERRGTSRRNELLLLLPVEEEEDEISTTSQRILFTEFTTLSQGDDSFFSFLPAKATESATTMGRIRSSRAIYNLVSSISHNIFARVRLEGQSTVQFRKTQPPAENFNSSTVEVYPVELRGNQASGSIEFGHVSMPLAVKLTL